MATITLKGNEIQTIGDLPAVGSKAPGFSVTGGDLQDVALSSFAGKRKVLNIVPSLDTGVCAASAKRFNEEATSLADTVILNISADLPFAQGRFCDAEGLSAIANLSTFRSPEFGTDYGILMSDGPLAGLLGRAVVVLDGQGQVTYTELVPEIVQEPNYEAALAAVKG